MANFKGASKQDVQHELISCSLHRLSALSACYLELANVRVKAPLGTRLWARSVVHIV
jgi:hypothetical protein